MYTLTHKSQFQAWLIKNGKHKLAAEPQEIVDWITKEFGVHALDYSCETRETSKGRRQQIIHLILETVEDVTKIQADRAGITAITERFLKYLKSPDRNNSLSDPLKSNVFPAESNPFPEIIVTCRPFVGLDGKIWTEMFEDEKRAILATFESVWTMSVYVVFYYTDAQLKENQKNGINTKIIDELVQVTEKYGYDRGTSYRFDSKESFDRDYDGKWHYYWK